MKITALLMVTHFLVFAAIGVSSDMAIGKSDSKKALFLVSKAPDGPKKPSLVARIAGWFKDRLAFYCSVTSLHIWNLFVRPAISVWERAAWIVLWIVTLITTCGLIYVSLHWTAETPTVTLIESTSYPTWNIPFPAVSFCPVNKMSAKAVDAKVKKFKLPENTTVDEAKALMRTLIHFNGNGEAHPETYQKTHEIMTLNNLTVSQFLLDVAPDCSEMFEKCLWKGTQVRCEAVMQPNIAISGYCCSFNYFGGKLRLKSKSKGKYIQATEPRRVSASGFQNGLSVIVNLHPDDYFSASTSTHGMRLMIHGPFNYPADNAESKYIQKGLEAFLSVKPESTYATAEVISQPLLTRECYSPSQVHLESMVRYTYMNCLMECRRLIMLHFCGCVPYNYPRNGSERVCQMDDISCYLQYKSIAAAAVPPVNLSMPSLEDTHGKGHLRSSCGCMPDCIFNNYVTEISTGILNRRFSFSSQSFYQGVKLTNQSVVNVFYTDLSSTRYRTDMYQNWMSVLAMFGGLTGLFLGFSLVTGYELCYMFSVRALFDYLGKKKKKPGKVIPLPKPN